MAAGIREIGAIGVTRRHGARIARPLGSGVI
jgi:hypothetical protein